MPAGFLDVDPAATGRPVVTGTEVESNEINQEELHSFLLHRLVNGYQVSQAIYAAASLRIADALAVGPRSVEELSAETASHPPSLYRLLRALASIGIFHELEGKIFSLTSLGDCLRSDAPESLHSWANFVGRPYYWNAWGQLLHSIRTGENAFEQLYDTNVWEYRTRHPEEGAIFDNAMMSLTKTVNRSLIEAFDFGRFGAIVDVGGGNGALLANLLSTYPSLNGVLFDLPHVVASANQVLGPAGVAGRCLIEHGDFFEAVPEGGDGYVLKAIIHDWEDDASVAILSSVGKAMPQDGTLLVIERLLGPANEEPEAKFSDLNMLVSPGGRERTIDEFAALFEAADFRIAGTTATTSGFFVIEGLRA